MKIEVEKAAQLTKTSQESKFMIECTAFQSKHTHERYLLLVTILYRQKVGDSTIIA